MWTSQGSRNPLLFGVKGICMIFWVRQLYLLIIWWSDFNNLGGRIDHLSLVRFSHAISHGSSLLFSCGTLWIIWKNIEKEPIQILTCQVVIGDAIIQAGCICDSTCWHHFPCPIQGKYVVMHSICPDGPENDRKNWREGVSLCTFKWNSSTCCEASNFVGLLGDC